ncbi:hypothetical protein EDB87DRAFT_1651101 [Lactarius vividus]|nr:hypothetical protein EDB87DRAFT_1651101 [Lactarius vividus]
MTFPRSSPRQQFPSVLSLQLWGYAYATATASASEFTLAATRAHGLLPSHTRGSCRSLRPRASGVWVPLGRRRPRGLRGTGRSQFFLLA